MLNALGILLLFLPVLGASIELAGRLGAAGDPLVRLISD